MGIEIERKYLVDASKLPELSNGVSIRQAFFPVQGNAIVRIRIQDKNAWLTLKDASTSLSRLEFEYPIPVVDAEKMIEAFCPIGPVSKTRYTHEHKGRTWEINRFAGHNKGLLLAETELTSVDDVVDLPAWVEKEVTSDPKYYNYQLAVNPYDSWQAGTSESRFCDSIASRIDTYNKLLHTVANSSNVDTIHDFRVASRNLLAIQTLFEDNAGSRHCFKQIKYYLHLYTRLRDLQVLKHRYKKHSGLKTLLKEEIRKEKKKIRKKIEALDPQDITTQLGTIYNVLCNEKLSIEKTRDLTQRLWLSTHKKLEQRLQSVDFENPDSLHKLRISFKPVRYVTVFFKDTGLVPSVQMDPLKYWQDILGSINDLKVAGLWLDNNPSHQEFRQQVSEYSSRAIESFKSEIGEFKQFIEQIDQQVLKATANNNLS